MARGRDASRSGRRRLNLGAEADRHGGFAACRLCVDWRHGRRIRPSRRPSVPSGSGSIRSSACVGWRSRVRLIVLVSVYWGLGFDLPIWCLPWASSRLPPRSTWCLASATPAHRRLERKRGGDPARLRHRSARAGCSI